MLVRFSEGSVISWTAPPRATTAPQVLLTFAEYRRVPGILERGTSVSHAFPSETEAGLLCRCRRGLSSLMEFSALTPATGGQVEILESLWPPLADADGQRACVCYVLMLRTDGLLLCVPGSFFSPGELAPEGDDGAVRPGPSVQLTAPAVALSEEGEWLLAFSADPLAVTVVDFPASAASLLSELDSFLGTFFSEADPGLYPLAADVPRQARQWILVEGAGASTDYQTGASDPGQPQTEAR